MRNSVLIAVTLLCCCSQEVDRGSTDTASALARAEGLEEFASASSDAR